MNNSEKVNQEVSKKWYDNKIIVGVLIIVFFPIGLYTLWKSNTISMGWKVGCSIVVCLFVISALTNDDLKELSEATASKENVRRYDLDTDEKFSTDITKKLNISYDEMLINLQSYFSLEREGTTYYGLPTFYGAHRTNTDTLVLGIVGERDNIVATSLSMFGSNDEIKARLSESSIVKQFLKNAMLNSQNITDWITDTYLKLYNQRKNKKVFENAGSRIYGQKEISLILINGVENLNLKIGVQHKDYFNEN